ncbi:MAG TPA: PrsW family glutamic-type intramembrane protease [Longilinea sp.]|nr:PrsW family glutamic-type intramembrane protease [Longilinea sp.]
METPLKHTTHVPSILQLILSGFGIAICGLAALLLFAAGFINWAATGSTRDSGLLFSSGWVALLIFVLVLPSIIYAIVRLARWTLPSITIKNRYLIAAAGLILWPIILYVGNDLALADNAGILLPFLQLFAVGLPIWWLLETGQRGLSTGSSQRTWGMVSFSLLVSPLMALVIEAIAMVIVAILVFVLIGAQQPELFDELGFLIAQNSNGLDPTILDQTSRQLLSQPGVILALLVLFSGIAPMVEELIKPLALWVIAPRRPTPAQGFVCGLICGAAFALLESLGIASSSTGDVWLLNMLQRSGTGLLHVTTCGLMGWGLASAWSEQKYLRTGLAFCGAVLLHGTWNAFGLLMGFIPYVGQSVSSQLPAAAWMSQAAPFALGILAFTALFILFYLNRQLRREQSAPQPPSGGNSNVTIPPTVPDTL